MTTYYVCYGDDGPVLRTVEANSLSQAREDNPRLPWMNSPLRYHTWIDGDVEAEWERALEASAGMEPLPEPLLEPEPELTNALEAVNELVGLLDHDERTELIATLRRAGRD